MRTSAAWVLGLCTFVLLGTARADLASIHRQDLPQEVAVLAALDDAGKLEAYSEAWTPKWKFDISKDEVAARLSKDLAALKASMKAHPENAELQLAAALVSHYGYNVDVEGTYDFTLKTLEQVIAAKAGDIRGRWFRAGFVCQTDKPAGGAEEFLALEAGNAWEELPAAFWSDYAECLQVVGMPAHVLRAIGHLEKLGPGLSELMKFHKEIAEKQFDDVDPSKSYEGKDAWFAGKAGEGMVFSSSACGMSLKVRGDWQVQQLALTKGKCVALFGTGPYRAKEGKLSPSIMVFVQRPESGQTLTEFLNRMVQKYQTVPETTTECPIAGCVRVKVTQEGTYGKNGGLSGRAFAFERNEPEVAGIPFESPMSPNEKETKPGMNYYRPNQVLRRMPGKLYYLVLLDVAASIEEPGVRDLEFFLKNLKVE